MPEYCHLHNHTEFSLLDGAAKIERLIDKACSCGMKAVAISDHGNMYGLPKFVLNARKKGIKPIIGSEFYVAQKSRHEKKDKLSNDTYHQILWAANEEGYKNLSRLSSIAFNEGYHYNPRIDKEILVQYHQGIIASTCCLASEVNQSIVSGRLAEAEEIFKWYLNLFGENYYIEIQRHGLKDMDRCNEVLLTWAKKYNVKVIATNDVHYVNKEDSEAHDLLLALQTGSDYNDPNRFRFTDDNNKLNPNFYFKTQEEMSVLFADVPEALENTLEIADKCNFNLNLNGDLFLPNYPVPKEFASMDDYLRFLAFEGAKKRYPEPLPTDVADRIDNELKIIKQMGFAGYFLIVQEFTTEARKRGVMVGPGRGSAAGSVVAYCVGIIDIDPIRYSLLFERFLNPERVSPPDIDIDFDDEGRQAVIDFVIERYGAHCVSQIITYGTMGAKTAIRDVGRTLGIPLAEVNRIAKFIPEKPGMTFAKALTYDENPDGYLGLKDAFDSPDPLVKKMLAHAQTLEGTARQTGIHAAGVIIAPGNVSDYVPTAINNTKDRIITTQFDGPNAELAGLLKMDFLGLKTLSIIKTAVRLVKENRGIEVDIDHVSLEDPKTFELYQKGETVATFQFESDGMRKYLRQLKPTNIEDLIAMNALYRPGPMDNIPSFINRKQGAETIIYPHPMLEPILSMTYGIMVYQEQIMEVAKTMARYSLGGADLLRRAMGKKKADVMEKEKATFVKGAVENGVDAKVAGDVFGIMEKFASYGFNKSHSAAYSVLAFRTGYLKANYPEEYMAAVLSHNLDHIEKITFFIEECTRMGISVLPPSVNESKYQFSVSKPNQIRFGLGAIKGLGEASAQAIIAERAANGAYKSIFDLMARVPPRMVNKKSLEALAYGGAFDCFEGIARSRYFHELGIDKGNSLDRAAQYGARVQQEKLSNQISMFGGGGAAAQDSAEPDIPFCEPWPLIVQLNHERDVIGFYLSGHPLDKYKLEMKAYSNTDIVNIENNKGKKLRFGGIVTHAQERMSKKGTKFGIYTIEDKSGAVEVSLFGEDFPKFNSWLQINNCVFIMGEFRPRFRDSDQYELRIDDVKMLDSLMSVMTKEIGVDIPLKLINSELITNLDRLFANFKGNCAVKFNVFDPELNQQLQFLARTTSVKPEPELFSELEKLDLQFSILK